MSNLRPELNEELRDLIRSLLTFHQPQGFIFSDQETDVVMQYIGKYVKVRRNDFVGLKTFTLIDTKRNRRDLKELLKLLEM